MSKSKGNVVVPNEPLEQFGADAVRYWAASARLGADTAYEISQMKIGRRLAIKLLNASKFAFGMGVTEEHIVGPGTDSSVITEPLDQALLAKLRTVVQQATEHFDDYDYARALSLTESFFWSFTDDYVELVKDRAYGAQGEQAQASVRATLATALDKLLRLFAPVLPFATDEVWRWWRRGSVHAVSWPQPAELDAVAGSPAVLDAVAAGLTSLRRAKAEANVKQRTEILSARITGSQQEMESVRSALRDLQAATKSQVLQLESADDAAPEIVVSELQLAEAGTA